ncbi:MAG: energy-coupling factor ABC transporter permease [Candidatus Asgardarchaeia archaeon]
MHIPDGYLDLWIIGVCAIFSILVIAISVIKLKNNFDDKQISTLAVLTAVVFAAQMINWPVGPGGTTAHLVGGALIAIFMGPFAAVISMAVILLIQALIFNDGGILALGANIFNMGVIDVFVGYLLFIATLRTIRDKKIAVLTGSFLAGWLGITTAAFACGVELGLSTIFPYEIGVSVAVMTIYHALLGLIEGAITAFAVFYVMKVRPDLILTLKEVSIE